MVVFNQPVLLIFTPKPTTHLAIATMKPYLLLLLFVSVYPFNISAQTYSPDQLLSYQQVESADSLTATQIIERAKTWAIKYYTNYQSVVQDETTDRLVLNGNFKIGLEIKGYPAIVPVAYQLTIEAKDSRYRITIENLQRINNVLNTRFPFTNRETTLQQIEAYQFKDKIKKEAIANKDQEFTVLQSHFAQLFTSIKEAISKNPKKDDW